MGTTQRYRDRAVQRLRGMLEHRGAPRLQMTIMLMIAGLVGFVSSGLLRRAGVGQMWLRYPACVAIAYVTFLLLLGLWVSYLRARHRRAGGDRTASDDMAWVYWYDPWPGRRSTVAPSGASGGTSAGTSGGGGSGFSLGGGGGDGDALALILVVALIIIALGAVLIASVWVVIEAPALLAEAAVDGALLAGMARRMGGQAPAHWTRGVVAHTFWPVLAVAVCFALVGFGLTWVEPGSTSMAEAFRLARDGR